MKDQKHFPLALKKQTNTLVHVNDVENGLKCLCYCFACGSDLIAVNNGKIQTSHFRHVIDANCNFVAKYESYVHWLSKLVLQNITSIKLPAINLGNLNVDRYVHDKMNETLKQRLIIEGIFDDINQNEISFYNAILQPQFEIKIDKCDLEQTRMSQLGSVRIDAVINASGNELFIEPFWTNPIDSVKILALKDLDISTISIDLFEFVKRKTQYFTFEELSNFIKDNVSSKKWVFVKEQKLGKLIDDMFGENFERKIREIKEGVLKYRILEKEIQEKIEIRNQAILEIEELSARLPSKSIRSLCNNL
jgi:hypothetical protein